MKNRISNRLASARKRRGFTQAETAFLLGIDARQRISRYELEDSEPHLDELLLLEIVFEMPIRELFPDRYERAKEVALKKMDMLVAKLEQNAHRLAPFKQEHLREAIARIKRSNAV